MISPNKISLNPSFVKADNSRIDVMREQAILAQFSHIYVLLLNLRPGSLDPRCPPDCSNPFTQDPRCPRPTTTRPPTTTTQFVCRYSIVLQAVTGLTCGSLQVYTDLGMCWVLYGFEAQLMKLSHCLRPGSLDPRCPPDCSNPFNQDPRCPRPTTTRPTTTRFVCRCWCSKQYHVLKVFLRLQTNIQTTLCSVNK
jgi:hypothetical protein